MKKLLILAVLSVFSFSAAAAFACDGMKGHDKASSDSQAKNDKAAKDKAKTDGTKSDNKS